MDAHGGAALTAADLYSIADLVHKPEAATAASSIRSRPDLARQRIGDVTSVLHLANDLITSDPASYSTWPVGMGQCVRGQLGDGDD